VADRAVLGTAAPILAWKTPSVQVLPGLLWQTAHSIPATPVTDTPPIVTADVNSAL